jgi:hypothetical protein
LIYLRLTSFAFLFLLFITGCKDPDELGLEVLPTSDQLQMVHTDSLTVNARAVKEDSLRSDELSVQLIGSYIDPFFGKAEATAYTQVLLLGTPNFSSHQVTDSLVLRLFYKGFYGDTNTQQLFRVSRLTEDMYADSVYFSNKTFTAESNALGTTFFYPRPNSKIVIDSDTVAPQLRIRLSQQLADSLVLLNGSDQYLSNEKWLSYFKGLKLETNSATVSGQGCISIFDLFNSRMTLYYHDTSNIAKTYSWSMAGAKTNNFVHEFDGYSVASQLQDSSYTDSLVSVQAMAGIKTRFDIPYLNNLKDSGNIVVNRALLTVSLQDGSTATYGAPPSLTIVAIDSSGSSTYFPADFYESSGYFGGTISGQTYTFNLTRQISRILSGAVPNNGFYLVVSGSSIQASRAILGSGRNATYPIKLDIYYTRLP